MRRSVILQIVLGVCAALSSGMAFANNVPTQQCDEFNWKPKAILPVQGTMNRHLHIVLPEESMDVMWASKDLWEVDWVKNHLFVKALTAQPAGAVTTITAVGQSGNSYDIEVRRVATPRAMCVYVTTSGPIVNHAVWRQPELQQSAQIQALQGQVARLSAEKVELTRDGDRKAREAIKMYRSAINTNYGWSNAEGWYAAGGEIVESVYDDGRFTYVKLKSDNRGLMTIQAEIDGKKEVLESTYDASVRTHKISGIFPKFVMRAGNSELTITRKGA